MDFITMVKGVLLILLLLFIPGYAVTMALFPKKKSLDTVERIALSFLFGLTPQFILYFISKNFLVPINTTTVLGTIVLVCALSAITWAKRQK